MIQCAVFDIDDTLYLERDYVASGLRAVEHQLQSEGRSCDGYVQAGWRRFLQGQRSDVISDSLVDVGIEAEQGLVAALVSVYRCHLPSISLLPDATQCLSGLCDRFPVAFLTDGRPVGQMQKVYALGLRRFGAVIICTAMLGPGHQKPSTRGYEEIERRVEVPGHACVYVADNPAKDFDGAKRRGWATVRVRRQASLHEGIPSGEDVDVECFTLDELPALLASGWSRTKDVGATA